LFFFFRRSWLLPLYDAGCKLPGFLRPFFFNFTALNAFFHVCSEMASQLLSRPLLSIREILMTGIREERRRLVAAQDVLQ